MQIAHHRLEGKLVTLGVPYALLRTTPVPSHLGEGQGGQGEEDEGEEELPVPKRMRMEEEGAVGSSPEKQRVVREVKAPRIEIVGLVRRKIVFSKRPEPIVTPLQST